MRAMFKLDSPISTNFEFDSNSTSLRELHLKKQCPPSFSTFFGIQIDSRGHSAKA
jgi:hypothetical protein